MERSQRLKLKKDATPTESKKTPDQKLPSLRTAASPNNDRLIAILIESVARKINIRFCQLLLSSRCFVSDFHSAVITLPNVQGEPRLQLARSVRSTIRDSCRRWL
jgi:hypothetical protein